MLPQVPVQYYVFHGMAYSRNAACLKRMDNIKIIYFIYVGLVSIVLSMAGVLWL